jgi:ketol-acid reductoisomerase
VSAPLGRIAILGYGNQGAAQATLLRRSGGDVIVGARAEGAGARRAAEAGFEVMPLADALAAADVAAVLLPDEALPERWNELGGSVREGHTLVFAHGFNLLYGNIECRPGCDVVLVSPTAPGTAMLEAGERGERIPAYLAIHQDDTGSAWATAEAYADRLGCGPLRRTTVREETEVDLFGEQVVLCGGMNALVLAAFDTLVDKGYTPEVAYLECVHQLRYLAELLHARGPAGFRRAISGTARYGDLTRGPRVIGPAARRAMEEILEEIRDGRFAREWQAEVRAGTPHLRALEKGMARRPIERARHRALEGQADSDTDRSPGEAPVDPPGEASGELGA